MNMKIFALIVIISISPAFQASAQEGLTAGDRIPEFNVDPQDGDQKSVNEITSKLILIDFWAGYCKPCLWSIKRVLKPLYNTYSRDQLEIIGINVDTSPELWVKSAEKAHLPWFQIYDHDRSLMKAFDVKAIPRYFLVDENKTIIDSDLKSDEIKKAIIKYLGK